MNRLFQVILIGSTIVVCWLGMQAVHECGHVLGAWLTGGRVVRVVLSPLTISRTDLAENPVPLIVVWAGPVFGAVAPVAVWGLIAVLRRRSTFVLRFFAGFCLAANGLYLGVGSIDGVGDCGDILRHGSPMWTLWLFCGITTPIGLWLWHGQGKYFGMRPDSLPVDRNTAVGTLVCAAALAGLGFLIDGR